MPTFHTAPDRDGVRASVDPHALGGPTVWARRDGDPIEDDRAAVIADPLDRRRFAEVLLGQPVITRDELATVMSPHSTVPGEVGLLAAVRDFVRRVHDDTARLEQDRDTNQETAARLTGVVADLSAAAQVLEAEVLVRRSDLPPVTDGTDDYAGERVVLCGDAWAGADEEADDVFDAAPIGPSESSQVRRRAGALSALALWVDAEDRAANLAALRRTEDDALAELIAGALSERPEGSTAAEVVALIRSRGWQLTPPPAEVPF